MEKMKKFKRRLSQTLRGSHTIDESLSELAEQMTIEENGLKDSGEVQEQFVEASYVVGVTEREESSPPSFSMVLITRVSPG